MTSVDSRNAYAGAGEVALVSGGAVALRSLQGHAITGGARGKVVVAGASAALGATASLAGEGVARLTDTLSPLDRTESHLLLGGAGLATALLMRGRSVGAGAARTIGLATAVTGGAGVALDAAHRRFDSDADSHFFPDIPNTAAAGAISLGVLGAGAIGGRKALVALQGSKRIASGGAAADAAGTALGEVIPRSKLGLPGRMFLDGRTTGLAAEPVRTYMPFELDGKSLAERARLTVDSMEAQGAFAKSHITIGSPTGTGGFNPVPIAMDELLSGGDSAWVIAQYGKKPSVQSLNKVDEGSDAFMALTREVAARKARLYPNGGGPQLNAAATSLGALNLQEALLKHSDEIFGPEIGMQRMLLIGSPEGLTKWNPAHLADGESLRVRTADDLAAIMPEQADRLKVLEFAHHEDPVRLVSYDMAVRRPDWMTPEGAVPGVAYDRPFTPIVTALQHGNDVMASIARSTGPTIRSEMHDYRGDMQRAVAIAFDHLRKGDDAINAAATTAQERASAEVTRIRSILAGKKQG